MSLQSFVGNAVTGVENKISTALGNAKTAIEGIIGSASASITSLWDGGFAGISESGVAALKDALNKYVEQIEEVIAGFDENGNLENAFKGKIQEAAQEYIRAIKELLQAYVTTMRVNISDLDSAFEAYMEQSGNLATSVGADAESVRSQAASIKLD